MKCGQSSYKNKAGNDVNSTRVVVKDTDGTGLLDAVEINLPAGNDLPVGKVFDFDVEDIFGGGTQRFRFTVYGWKESREAKAA